MKYHRSVKKISQDELIKKFPNTYQLCIKDLNKSELLLQKGVYPYEYMDSWKRFKEESFYSELNKEGITDEDYAHAQKVWDTFNIKNVGEYHDLYVQSDTLLLADVFETFRKNMSKRISTRSCTFCICTRFSMASMSKTIRCKT